MNKTIVRSLHLAFHLACGALALLAIFYFKADGALSALLGLAFYGAGTVYLMKSVKTPRAGLAIPQ